MIKIADFIDTWDATPFAKFEDTPWALTHDAPHHISDLISRLGDDYLVRDDIAIHRSAVIEPNATLKGPIIIGENCLVANGAYVRGGVFLDRNCIIGPSCEVKTVFMLEGSKIAHLSFVGDSIIGKGVNIEAGAMVANYRNEMADKQIRIAWNGDVIETGYDKFGALMGDDVRIGANAVVAPGALLPKGQIVARLERLDMHPEAI